MDNCFIQPRRPVGLYRPEFEHDSCGVGFVANIKGQYSHSIIDDAYTVLRSMDHRGACGADENSGDGAGILTALPHQFLQRVVEEEIGARLPEAGSYGAGTIFLPQVAEERERCKQIVESII